jgi:hypothetical protein
VVVKRKRDQEDWCDLSSNMLEISSVFEACLSSNMLWSN